MNGHSAATYGGGIYSDSLAVTLQNSTISSNSAGTSLGDSGGGIINYEATLTSVTAPLAATRHFSQVAFTTPLRPY